jgi:hypothetical protein
LSLALTHVCFEPKAMGLDLPLSLQLLADEVIE